MMTRVNSNLNPLANTFVPLKPGTIRASAANDTKVKASKILEQTMTGKDWERSNLTNAEIFNLTVKLISHLYPQQNILNIKYYLENKLHHFMTSNSLDLKTESFNFSSFRSPKPTFLIVPYCGLNKHELASRPTLLGTKRTENLKDQIWSVKPQDLMLWNACTKEENCGCPPMFGYTIPAEFFGNPFQLKICIRNDVHLNHYAEVNEGCEHLLAPTTPTISPAEDDFHCEYSKRSMEYYSEHLKEIVYGVCDLITNTEPSSRSGLNQSLSLIDIEGELSKPFCEMISYEDLYWDTECEDVADKFVDDDNHPLLDATNNNVDEDIPPEIKEMLFNNLSRYLSCNNEHSSASNTPPCDPNYSDWCQTCSDIYKSSDTISLLRETSDFLMRTKDWLLPSTEPEAPGYQRPSYKRSFSANDCDPSCESKASQLAATREALNFLRNDPINFYRQRDRKQSWKDSDSGISSHWSSQEDVFGDGSSEHKSDNPDEGAPMWNLFNGEGSLWKPLSDGTTTEQPKISHKRVRDLRRQKSVN